jgi:hypothetical protein
MSLTKFSLMAAAATAVTMLASPGQAAPVYGAAPAKAVQTPVTEVRWGGRVGWGGGRVGWGGWHGGWHGRGWGWGGVGAGIAAGAVLGGLAAGPYYGYYGAGYPYYYDYGPAYPDPTYAAPGYVESGDVAYCAQRYRSYDPQTGTFLGKDGRRHPCP